SPAPTTPLRRCSSRSAPRACGAPTATTSSPQPRPPRRWCSSFAPASPRRTRSTRPRSRRPSTPRASWRAPSLPRSPPWGSSSSPRRGSSPTESACAATSPSSSRPRRTRNACAPASTSWRPRCKPSLLSRVWVQHGACMKARRLPVTDAMFLYGETRETMLHVASLMPFTPAPDAPPDHLRALVDELRGARHLAPPWNLKLRHPDSLRHPLQAWVEDPDVDIDYHVRRSALPAPGDERELGVLVSRLHSNNLDFSRPPWEMHIIEGLECGRFAFYTKMHHALIDGYTGMKLVARALSPDPAARDTPLFISTSLPVRAKPESEGAMDAPGLLALA